MLRNKIPSERQIINAQENLFYIIKLCEDTISHISFVRPIHMAAYIYFHSFSKYFHLQTIMPFSEAALLGHHFFSKAFCG